MFFPSHRSAAPLAPVLPSSHPLGHLQRMRDDPLGLFMDARALGEEVVRFRFGTFYVYALLGRTAVCHALVDHPDRFIKGTRGQRLMQGILGNSILTTDGPEWRWRRRLAQPAFKRPNLVGFAAAMQKEADAQVDSWTEAVDQPVAVDEAMMAVTLRIATATLFGADLGEAREAVVHTALGDVLSTFLGLVTAPWPWPDKVPTPSARRHQAAVRAMEEVVDGLIAERRAAGGGGDDLLGMLMSATGEDGEALTDEQLRAETITMLLAGHETTANALTWTFSLLGRHPSVSRRLHAEVTEVLGDRAPCVADLRRLPLTDAVLREAMRLYPPAWVVSRATVQDETIAGAHVPAGSYVFSCVYALHRDPEVFSDPEGFDPDRWLDGRTQGNPRLSWMPFGAGQHKCIGEHFAMMEAVILLATVTRSLHLELVPGQALEMDPSITLRPAQTIRMVPRRR
ncbi:MAG: cytochrome P450 [Myxococcota bacterium]|jgi:cytochrome P450